MGSTIAWHMYFRRHALLSHPLQSKKVQSPKFVWSENRNPDTKSFKFLFGTQNFPLHYAEVGEWHHKRW